jgi:hypothetical protein
MLAESQLTGKEIYTHKYFQNFFSYLFKKLEKTLAAATLVLSKFSRGFRPTKLKKLN